MEQYEEKMAKYFPQLFKAKAKMVAKPATPPAPAKPTPAPVVEAKEDSVAVVKAESNGKALPAAPADNHKANGSVEATEEAEEANA